MTACPVRPGLAVAIAFAVLCSFAGPARAQDTKSIFVSVFDGDGKPVEGMTAADFAIREDKVDRQVVSVTPAVQPLFITVLVDTTTAAQDYISDIREGLVSFVGEVLSKSPESQIALWEFGQSSERVQDFTSDAAALTERINRMFPEPNASSVLLEALIDASRSLEKAASPRRAIVVVNLEPSEEVSREAPKKINESLMKSHTQLWAVSIQKGALKNAQRDVVLNALVRNAGGTREYIVTPSALTGQLGRIAGALTTQYEVSYSRPGGKATVVQVGTYRQNLKLIAGLFAPK